MERQVLKDQLIKCKENDFDLPKGINLKEITENMLYYIGVTDAELRDALIYETFFNWIVDKQYYNQEQLIHMVKVAVDEDHLFYQLGNHGDDSVFTRAFSALLIPLLLERERLDPFLNEGDIEYMKENVFLYFQEETDYRGFVPEKGWADATSHGADALAAVAQNSYTTHDDLFKVLELIKNKVAIKEYAFVNEEDERLVTAIMNLLDRNMITDQAFIDWIYSFTALEKPTTHPEMHAFLHNIKGLLRSLYFRILKGGERQHFLIEISTSLNTIVRF